VSGPIRVVASADLGGLGHRDGAAAHFTWTPPSLVPVVLPWMAVLLLLLLPPNRSVAAWCVMVPLAAVGGLDLCLRHAISSLSSEGLDLLRPAFISAAFGVTALWLAGPYLSGRTRVGLFFLALGTLGLAGVWACAAHPDWRSDTWETFAFLGFLACGALTAPLAISLAALVSRKRYSALRLLLWTAVFLAMLWAPLTPLGGLSHPFSGREPLRSTLSLLPPLTSVTLLAVVPFLLLAFTGPNCRGRLLALMAWRGRANRGPRPPPTGPGAAANETADPLRVGCRPAASACREPPDDLRSR